MIEPAAGAVGVGADVDADDEGPAAARQLAGVALGAVQEVAHLDQPGQGGSGVHGALVIDGAVGGGGQGDGAVAAGDGVGGGHVADGGVMAVVGDGHAGGGLKPVDGVKALHRAVGGQLAVDHFLFGGRGGAVVFLQAGGSVLGRGGLGGRPGAGRGAVRCGRSGGAVRGKDGEGRRAENGGGQQGRGGAAGQGVKFHGDQPSFGAGAEAPGLDWTMNGSMR